MVVRHSVGDLEPRRVLEEQIAKRDLGEGLLVQKESTVHHKTLLAAEKTSSAVNGDGEDGTRLISSEELRQRAIRRVEGRMRWKPSNPVEEEIREIAIDRAERLLMEENKE